MLTALTALKMPVVLACLLSNPWSSTPVAHAQPATDGEAEPATVDPTPPAPESEPKPTVASPAKVDETHMSEVDGVNTDEAATEPQELGDISYRLIGYMRMEAAFVQDDETTEFVGRNDGFRLQNARLGVEGSWHDALKIRLSADGAIDERDDPNETKGTLRFALKDAYGELALSPRFHLRVGRFQANFDIERGTSPSKRSFARRALSARGVAPTEGFETEGLAISRNLGVAFLGEFPLAATSKVGFELAVQNGNGESDAVNDNDALAYSASVYARLRDAITAFTSARYNRRTQGDLPFRRTEDDIDFATGVRTSTSAVRATVQLLFRRRKFPTTGGPVENALGVHAEALLRIPSMRWLEAGYRFSLLDPSDLFPSDKIQEHTIGVNIFAPKWRSVLQINGTHAIEQSGAVLDNSRIEAVVQVSL